MLVLFPPLSYFVLYKNPLFSYKKIRRPPLSFSPVTQYLTNECCSIQIPGVCMKTIVSSGFATHCRVRFATAAVAFCCAVLVLFTSSASADCYLNCPLITIINCRNAPAQVQAQLCCYNTETTFSEVFTVPAGTCNSNPYSIGFLPCYVTGVFLVDQNATSYTWDGQNCRLIIH